MAKYAFPRLSLRRKLFFYFFSVFILVLSGVFYFQYNREKEFRAAQLNHQLSTYNFIIYKFIQENPNPSHNQLQEYIHLFPDTDLRLTLISLDGKVWFDSSVKNPELLENHLSRPEILDAKLNLYGTNIRHSHTKGIDYYYYASKFSDGYVRSALPYNMSLIKLLKANLFFVNFLVLLLVVGGFALYFISQKFSKSIERLRVFVENAHLEDAHEESSIEFSNDELGEISREIVDLYKQQRNTKKALRNEREKLINHLQISQEGLGIFTPEKHEILVNSHFIQYTNIISDQDVLSSEYIFQIPEFAEVVHFIDNSHSSNTIDKHEFIIRKGVYAFKIRCIIFTDQTFEVSINDISSVEHENELKKQLTQNISHELKTPVSSILGYLESIISNPDIDKEKQIFFIERSYKQTLRLVSLLNDISKINKMDESKRFFVRENCDLKEIIHDVLSDVYILCEKQNMTVVNNVNISLQIYGNRSLLYSIFRNLIDNAIAYAGQDVKVEISCFREDDQFYYFSFVDNGIGVEEEHLSRLFERFYRVDNGRSRKLGGTGLGLSIVKNAVIFHHGNIKAKHTNNGGLSFIFSIAKKD